MLGPKDDRNISVFELRYFDFLSKSSGVFFETNNDCLYLPSVKDTRLLLLKNEFLDSLNGLCIGSLNMVLGIRKIDAQ